ncbi:thioredoxin [Candidatus Pacearchaeota archaeon CG10_big_fil_rev_8_21_14_0_10_31_24]|nr:MAG: thioredoxin [Candidatus Pacearchaeota archaeon CG10_big_fil_rev_8_21_14_0_10_31_24]
MSENIKHLGVDDFDGFVSKGNSVIDFYADWCGPCKIMAPRFDEAASELKGKVNFAKVDVDGEQELAERFGVMSIPTIVFIKNGEVVDKVTGAISKEQILSRVKDLF